MLCSQIAYHSVVLQATNIILELAHRSKSFCKCHVAWDVEHGSFGDRRQLLGLKVIEAQLPLSRWTCFVVGSQAMQACVTPSRLGFYPALSAPGFMWGPKHSKRPLQLGTPYFSYGLGVLSRYGTRLPSPNLSTHLGHQS